MNNYVLLSIGHSLIIRGNVLLILGNRIVNGYLELPEQFLLQFSEHSVLQEPVQYLLQFSPQVVVQVPVQYLLHPEHSV